MKHFERKYFCHAWEAAQFVEQGGSLYFNTLASDLGKKDPHPVRDEASAVKLFQKGHAFYVVQNKTWYAKLDGTLENAVLCLVSERGQAGWEKDAIVDLIVATEPYSQYQSCSGTVWEYAVPLTKSEVIAFANNAPEVHNVSE